MIQLRDDLDGLLIPDAREGVDLYYSPSELEGAEQIGSCDTTGDVTARLKDNRVVVLYSADLD
jgi:hypothetical protein